MSGMVAAWTRLHESQTGKAGQFKHYRMPVRQAEALINQVVSGVRQELQQGSPQQDGFTQTSELQGSKPKETVQRGWEHRSLATRHDVLTGPEGETLAETHTTVFESNGVKVFQQISQTPQGTTSRSFDFHYVDASGTVTAQEWFTPA